MSDNFFAVLPQYLAPQHLLSRFAGLLANCDQPWLKNKLIDYFMWRYDVDMSTALETDPHQYATFNQFFTRQLRSDARPIVAGVNTIASPADACISQLGRIAQGRIIQAKGFHYDVQDLLGGSAERAMPFAGGSFMTLYLAPKDYHRVHLPLAAELQEMIYVPGQLFSVNPLTTTTVPHLFARNERVAMIFNTAVGPMAVVMVGAMLVASIISAWEGVIAPARDKKVRVWDYRTQTKTLAKGEEVGHFQLGSTVVVLFGNENLQWVEGLKADQAVQYGQLLGQIHA